MRKKVLFYNWTQFDDPRGRGGGVSVYLRNVIPLYSANNIEVVFLSSGCHYSLLRRDIYYESTRNVYGELGVQTFRIMNSPIKAPSYDSFGQIENCQNNAEISELFLRVLREQGPFDEIHLHNIEGISSFTLKAISQASSSKIVLWFHNYHWVCPQIELFKNNSEKCISFSEGGDCVNCLGRKADVKQKIRAQRVVSFLELCPFIPRKVGDFLVWIIVRVLGILRVKIGLIQSCIHKLNDANYSSTNQLEDSSAKAEREEKARAYNKWRIENVDWINRYADVCIAVSGLVGDKMKSMGVSEHKIQEIPLGMDVYDSLYTEKGVEKARDAINRKMLRVGYLGSSNKSKGLSFLISAFQVMPDSLRDCINLKIYSKLGAELSVQVKELAKKMEVQVVSGYERSDLDYISTTIDLAIVPSVWWETYNQVSYEMIMKGVPVVVSDSVGISEYLSRELIYESGSTEGLIRVLQRIAEDKAVLESYWHNDEKLLLSLEQHFLKLQQCLEAILD